MSARFLFLLFLAPIAALAAAWWCWISPDLDEPAAPRWRHNFLFGSILSGSIATTLDMPFIFHTVSMAKAGTLPNTPIWNFAGLVAGVSILASLIALLLGKGSARMAMFGWLIAIFGATYIGMLPVLTE